MNISQWSLGASALGRQRDGRVSRLKATVVGFADSLTGVHWSLVI
ncbi:MULTISPECIES: hypothetical protein [Nostocaceae]|nr:MULTISPECIES: hypothetical protein [Nostocaceae]